MQEGDTSEQHTSPKRGYNTLVISLVVAALLVGGALYLRSVQAAGTKADKTFSARELAEFDGKEGRDCYVAVDGKVYKIEQGRLWKNGQHSSSKGEASCGRDLSVEITKSPHGKSKLTALEVVGTLKK